MASGWGAAPNSKTSCAWSTDATALRCRRSWGRTHSNTLLPLLSKTIGLKRHVAARAKARQPTSQSEQWARCIPYSLYGMRKDELSFVEPSQSAYASTKCFSCSLLHEYVSRGQLRHSGRGLRTHSKELPIQSKRCGCR